MLMKEGLIGGRFQIQNNSLIQALKVTENLSPSLTLLLSFAFYCLVGSLHMAADITLSISSLQPTKFSNFNGRKGLFFLGHVPTPGSRDCGQSHLNYLD